MGFLCGDSEISIRKMADCADDYQLMFTWLTQPAVQRYYGGLKSAVGFADVVAKYRPRAAGEEAVVPCIVELRGTPAGYIQYYRIGKGEDYDLRGEIILDFSKSICGIDLFLAHESDRGRGLGTRMIRLLLAYLFGQERADEVLVDPQTWNARAVRCYEKCGFRAVKVIEKRELHGDEYKDNLIMRVTRSAFLGTTS